MEHEPHGTSDSPTDRFASDALDTYYNELLDEQEQLVGVVVETAAEILAQRAGYDGMDVLEQFGPGKELSWTGNRPLRDGREQKYRFAARLDTYSPEGSTYEYNVVWREMGDARKLGDMSFDDRQRLLASVVQQHGADEVDETLIEALSTPDGQLLEELAETPCYTEVIYDYVCRQETLSIHKWARMAIYVGDYRVYDAQPGREIREAKAHRQASKLMASAGETEENIREFHHWGIELSEADWDDIERIEEVLASAGLVDEDTIQMVADRRAHAERLEEEQ